MLILEYTVRQGLGHSWDCMLLALVHSTAPTSPASFLGTRECAWMSGSAAGGGSADFHIYTRHRRTEQKRQERLDADDEKQRRDREHAERVDTE